MRKTIATIATAHHDDINYNHDDIDYNRFLHNIQIQFLAKCQKYGKAIFTTSVPEDLFQVFLDNLPAGIRQHYNCRACAKFVWVYGNTVFIAKTGEQIPAMWETSGTPELYRSSVSACYNLVKKAGVSGWFTSDERIWGTPVTGVWTHMAVIPPKEMLMLNASLLLTDRQIMAEKREDFKNLRAALGEFPSPMVSTAVAFLKSDSLFRSEKCLGVAKWLLNLHNSIATTKNRDYRQNMIWLAVATAPPGFCHIKMTMIGSLLKDIGNKLSFDAIEARFREKMNPSQYRRPTAPPSDGNIDAAEKIVEKMGIAPALERRFAKFDEIPKIWQPPPQPEKESPAGVFGHLRATGDSGSEHYSLPPQKITWVKFREEVLPEATQLLFYAEDLKTPYAAILTSMEKTDPLIFQWDNPFSWYVKEHGDYPEIWGVTPHAWVEVAGICDTPVRWNNPEITHFGNSVIFIISGCKDKDYKNIGNSIFPETLKAVCHPIAKTIEAFSRAATLHGFSDASACGIMLSKGVSANFRFKVVFDKNISSEYVIDRWD